MDKTPVTGMNILSYFNLAREKVSAQDAAEQLVKDLVGPDPAYDNNSLAHHSSSADTSARALAALQILHGLETPSQDGLPAMKEIIRNAQKAYVLQSEEVNQEKAAIDFDQRVKELLVNNLSKRMRPFYLGRVKELDDSFAKGEITKFQYDQELNLYIDEVKNPKHCLLQTEVKNALSGVGRKESSVLNSLYFLFKGELWPGQEGGIGLFETILEEISTKRFDSSNIGGDEEKKFRRAFVAEARRQLGSRLDKEFSADYFAIEKSLRDDIKNGKISYDDYVSSMRNWVDTRNLQRQVGSVLGDLNDHKNVMALLFVVYREKYSMWLESDNRYFHDNRLYSQCKKFEMELHNYAKCKSLGQLTQNEGRAEFLGEAERRLLRKLPGDIARTLDAQKKHLEKLLALDFINKDEMDNSRATYFASIFGGRDNKYFVSSELKIHGQNQLGVGNLSAADLVENGWAQIIWNNNRKTDVLKALTMFWNGSAYYCRSDFSLNPLFQARQDYFSINGKKFTKNDLLSFDFSDPFSIEARRRLVAVLPDEILKPYREREAVLSECYEKDMISREVFTKSMERFLNIYLGKKET